MKRTARTFDQLSDLNYTITSCECRDRLVKAVGQTESPLVALSIAFSGDFDDRGQYQHAAFMTGVIQWALAAWDSCGLVLDLRGLAYTWGDLMQSVLSAGTDSYGDAERTVAQIFYPYRPDVFPTAVIVSDRCRAAIHSLVEDEMESFAGEIVNTEEEAFNYIHQQWIQKPAT